MGGLINPLSVPGQMPGMARALQDTQGTRFQAVLGAAGQVASNGPGQPVNTPSVPTPHETLLARLGEVREQALAKVGSGQADGQTTVSENLSGLVSTLALAVAEFDQDTGLGLVPALRSGLAPDAVGGEPANVGPAATIAPLEADTPEDLNNSLQALVAVVGFVERTARVLPLLPEGFSGIQLADSAIIGTTEGAAIAQGNNLHVATTDAANVLAVRAALTAAASTPTTTGQTMGVTPATTTAEGAPLPPVGFPGIRLADRAIIGTTEGAAVTQGENTPAATTDAANALPVRSTMTVAASIPVTTGKTAGVLAGNPPMIGVGIDDGQTAGATAAATTGAGALISGKSSATSTTVVSSPVAAQSVPPVEYAATLSVDAVSAGTLSMPDQPRSGELRNSGLGATPVAGEPGTVRESIAFIPPQTPAGQPRNSGRALRQEGDAATRSVGAEAIGSQTSPAVVSDPRLVPLAVGAPGAPDPAPALLGQVVAQAFMALETGRERGAVLTWERPVDLNPLSGTELLLRAQPNANRPGLEQTASSGAPDRPRFAAALTAQIRAAEGRTVIELSPRGLGQVEVDIRTETDGSVKVTIRADNLMVLNTLRDAREMLAQSIGVADGAVLDFQEGSLGQEQGRQGSALTQGVTGDDDGLATAVEPVAQAEVIGGGQLDIMT